MNVIAGIDYSMTSPAICIHDGSNTFSFDRCTHYYLSRQAKLIGKFSSNIVGCEYPTYKTEIERFLAISKWVCGILEQHNVTHVYLEGYSMGSKGKVFHIAENTGILKLSLHIMNLPIESVPPTTIKKFATDKGNSDKTKMYSHYETYEPGAVDLHNLLTPNRTGITNPVSDIVDAYFICKYGYENLKSS